MQLAHPYQAQVREVRTPVCITRGQFVDPRNVLSDTELWTEQALSDECHYQAYATQVESCLSQYRFAGQQWLSDGLRNLQCPLVMGVSSVGESHQKTGIGDSLHFREKPLRAERSAGPSMAPARRRNGLLGDFRALSSSIRMMAPRDIPVF